MRADRLLAILSLLQKQGRLTARELAERLEVTERTIYRDVEALGFAGFSLSGTPGPSGGYSLPTGDAAGVAGLLRVRRPQFTTTGRFIRPRSRSFQKNASPFLTPKQGMLPGVLPLQTSAAV